MPTLASTICFVVHHAGGSAQHDGRPARDHPGQKKHTVDPEVVGDFRGAPVRLGFRLTLAGDHIAALTIAFGPTAS